MNLKGWWRLLVRNRFRVEKRYWHQAAVITLLSLFHSLYGNWQWVWVARRAARTEIKDTPLFVIGHWRSGTTLLHELLALDERHTAPTTYQCLVPNHFLMSEDFVRRWLKFLLPSHRPMDDMPVGWDRPQEDEFGLCNMGLPSPYLTIAFPNHPPQDQEYLTLEGLPPEDLEHWKEGFLRFLRQITYLTKKRIVLKNPLGTCRIKVLLEMFPEAKFVHIVRDPFALFASTVNLWKVLYREHGLQKPRFEGLEEHVFCTFERMYERFDADKKRIPDGHLCETRYEDLVRDPIGNLRMIYDALHLGEFEGALPAIEAYITATGEYRGNLNLPSSELREEIAMRWAGYMRQYGYLAETLRV
jgi:omega-hydroxy-beta-dihydromenaquinone-9 sulfotransferase